MPTRHSCMPRAPRRGCWGRVTDDRPLESCNDVVSAFITNYRQRFLAEREHYADCPLADAIRHAAYGETANGKRHPHHTRRSESTLKAAYAALRGLDFEACKVFGELLELVDDAIRPIDGVGDLFVYDAAVNIGANRKLEPERVYLHRGTREGASALGLDRGQPSLKCQNFRGPFAAFSPTRSNHVFVFTKTN